MVLICFGDLNGSYLYNLESTSLRDAYIRCSVEFNADKMSAQIKKIGIPEAPFTKNTCNYVHPPQH